MSTSAAVSGAGAVCVSGLHPRPRDKLPQMVFPGVAITIGNQKIWLLWIAPEWELFSSLHHSCASVAREA